ncbi:hypothetical protein [Stutzerimonas nitrititolerans]|uniref:hypothetical protein n=1 Tax=Stutzerimonas nitrititolerans TaxID=2482751 RepID=UPI0028A9E03A|nr:hypothetical protein [Stutzerimonas nitrititolerans]
MKYSFKAQLLACLLAMVFTLTLAACTATSAVGTAAATLVDGYCKAPEAGRLALRTTLAARTAPNRLTVECADAF